MNHAKRGRADERGPPHPSTPSAALPVVKNHNGGRLDFGLAAELARTGGLPVLRLDGRIIRLLASRQRECRWQATRCPGAISASTGASAAQRPNA